MSRVPIVFIFTDSFIVPAYIAVKSLVDNAKKDTKYEIILMHYDLSREHKILLKRLVSQTKHTIKFVKVDKRLVSAYPDTDHWPVVVYIRLFLSELLPDYDKVIYSDVDVLFQGDLSEVYHTDLEGYEWAGIKAELNNKRMKGHKYFENNHNKYVYMSGFMVCNLNRMREIGFADIVRENIRNYAKEILMFDLDILNMSSENIKDVPIRYAMLTGYNENKNLRKAYEYSYMKRVYTYQQLEREKKNKVIVHYAGGRGKPWLHLFPDYQYYKYICDLPKVLKRIYRKNLVNELRKR